MLSSYFLTPTTASHLRLEARFACETQSRRFLRCSLQLIQTLTIRVAFHPSLALLPPYDPACCETHVLPFGEPYASSW